MKRLLVKILLFVGLSSLLFAFPAVIVPLRSGLTRVAATEMALECGTPDPSFAVGAARMEYHPDIRSGSIGAPVSGQVDDAYDNIFIVDLDEQPSEHDIVWLTYELSGAPDHDAVPRSINDQRSTGGRLLRRSSGWHAQRERISPKSLRADRNVIRFGSYDPSVQHFALRDLKVIVEKGAAIGPPGIIITSASDSVFAGKAYIKGFIRGVDAAEITIDEQVVPLENGTFETVLNVGRDGKEILAVDVSVRSLGGTVIARTISLGKRANGELHEFSVATMPAVSSPFLPGAALRMECGDALLELDATSAKAPLDIEVRHLRPVDLPPMPCDLVNVVPNGAGYRFLPDGVHFLSPARLTLAYDLALIPQGYTAADVRAYYFDESARNWIAVPRDTLLIEASALRSMTTHFTDYINGIIKVPEAPETMGYQPTSIKDLKIGDASAGITPLALPEASSLGAMSTRFPLKLPPGRQGMQPDLSLTYSSEGGHSWTGLGWNLSGVSQITIDTRWGVPRYDTLLETETYTLDGEMLTPVAHRSEWVARTGSATEPKIFHSRVEGAFRRIQRFGSSPASYRWEITSKDGTVSYYGSAPGVSGAARLTDADGNIAKWGLVRVKDTNGNTIDYDYDVVEHDGTPGYGGKQLYLSRIRYTGHVPSSDPGKFSVTFHRDNGGARPDVNINARLGLVEVTAHRLDSIVVRYEDEVVRSYRLKYQMGAFRKSLLRAIIERDKAGAEFYRHEFEYFDEVDGTETPYADPQEWGDAPESGLGGHLMGIFGDPIDGPTSLGGSWSEGWSFGGSLTVGPPGDGNSKRISIGGNYRHTRSNGYGELTLLDINGDNLPDKLFRTTGFGLPSALYYRSGILSNSTSGHFADAVELNATSFSRSKTRGNQGGFEAHPPFVYFGTQHSSTETTTRDFLIDRNGDGLMDLVQDGAVKFNRIEDGVATFDWSSAFTECPISGGPIDTLIEQVSQEYIVELLQENPLHDVVRTWTAPYQGHVRISGTIELLAGNDEDFDQYAHDDGVKAWVQVREDDLQWILLDESSYGQPTDFPTAQPPPGQQDLQNVFVRPGDRIYFRLGSWYDGAYDLVKWDPISVEYVTTDFIGGEIATRDANGKSQLLYEANDDFLLTGEQALYMPTNGASVDITGTFDYPELTDAVLVEIISTDTNDLETVLFSELVAAFQAGTFVTGYSGELPALSRLNFRVTSTSNVAWQEMEWEPELIITSDNGNSSTFQPVVEYRTYGHVRRATLEPTLNVRTWPTQRVIVPDTVRLTFVPDVFQPFGVNSPGQGQVHFTVKVLGSDTVGLQTFPYDQFIQGPVSPDVSVLAYPGDTLIVEFHGTERFYADSLNYTLDVAWDTTGLGGWNSGDPAELTDRISESFAVYSSLGAQDGAFGPQYRRWGQFIYRGNDFQEEPIDESALTMGAAQAEPGSISSPSQLPNAGLGDFNPAAAQFVYMPPNRASVAYIGFDEFTYVKEDTMSASRLGEDDMSFLLSEVPAQGEAKVPHKKTTGGSEGFSVSGNVSLNDLGIPVDSILNFGVGVGYSQSDGTERSQTDVFDVNGDRYPDNVRDQLIQFTLPTGELVPNSVVHGLMETHLSRSSHAGYTASGSVSVSPKNSNAKSNGGSGSKAMGAETQQQPVLANDAATTSSLSVAGSYQGSTSKDTVVVTWMDINGDGLPDQVTADGHARLNLGYRFGPTEQWGGQGIRNGKNSDEAFDVNISGGLAYNIYEGSIVFGLGASSGESHSWKGAQDVNGDGLVDQMMTNGDGEIDGVWLNTGDGFHAVPWDLPVKLDEGYSEGTSLNAGFTFCINAVVARFCINPSYSNSTGTSGSKTQFLDMNGDGYADHVSSDEDGDLRVRYSTIGRTNLLKKVKGPIGSSFEVDYALTGNTYDLPQGKWVMSRLTTFDGFSDSPNGVGDSTLTTFSYAGGKYSRREREFYGFGEVVSRDHYTSGDHAVYRTTTRTFNVGDYYHKGLLVSSELRDADDVLWKRSENQYELRPPGFDPLDDAGWAFPSLTTTTESSYEAGGGPLVRRMAFEYDALGNVVRYEDLDVQSNEPVMVTIGYHAPLPGYICATPHTQTVSVGGVIRRERKQDQDGNGNITSIEQKIDEATWARHGFGYDGYGNLTNMQRPENHQGETLEYTYEYDPDVQTHVSRVTDSYGYSSSSTYFPEFGQLKSTTDINGEVTEYTVDARGRVDTVLAPYEREANREYTITVGYNTGANPAYAVVNHYNEDTDSDIQTVTFIDGLFRPVQVKKTGVFFNESAATETVIPIVSGRTTYDDFGRSVEQTYPLVLGGMSTLLSYTDDIDAVPPTKTTYDVLDRQLTVRLPDQSVTATSYAIVDDNGVQALRTRMIDAEGGRKDKLSDVRGNERARVDLLGSEAITTRSLINGIGELQQVMDVGGNVTAYTYDLLGRKLTYDHPDGGLTSYTYDPAGNLTHKLTANLLAAFGNDSGAIKYTYDRERLIRIDYPENFQNQVFYDYGPPGAEHGRAGRIWRQMDASGGQEFFYGPLGEVVKNIRTIIINQAQVHTYVWQQRYDSWNRVQEMAYPDGEIVDYEYNAAGKLRTMSGTKGGRQYRIIDRMGYDKFEQRVFMKHGNKAETRYSYEPQRRRLDTLMVDIYPEGASTRTIMRNDYGYDLVNNIESLTNDAVPEEGQLGGTMTAAYQYDSLYRLVGAQATYNGNARSDSYALQMEYDNLHNIVHKAQQDTTNMLTKPRVNHDMAYVYADEQERPHVPSRIGTRTYAYDANGNLTSWAEDHPTYLSRDFHWDEENRLKAIRHNGEMNFYTYDAAGERAVKSHGGMQAVYMNGAPVGLITHDRNWTADVSPYMVVTERGFTKHYYMEGQRVASRIGSGQFVFGPNSMPGLQAGNWDYHDRIQQLHNAQTGHANAQGESAHHHLTLPRPSGQNPYGTIATEPATLPDDYGWSNVWGQMQITHPTMPPNGPPTSSAAISSASATAGYGYGLGGNTEEVNVYFYHPDHLGSATYITGANGRVRQHIEYTAFGETFVEEHTSSDTQPYLYNGKELDSETGLYYYGARYYDPVTSIWASVDPMAQDNLASSAFQYVRSNPLLYVDPDGRSERVREYIQMSMMSMNPKKDPNVSSMKNHLIDRLSTLHAHDPQQYVGNIYLEIVSGSPAANNYSLAAKYTAKNEKMNRVRFHLQEVVLNYGILHGQQNLETDLAGSTDFSYQLHEGVFNIIGGTSTIGKLPWAVLGNVDIGALPGMNEERAGALINWSIESLNSPDGNSRYPTLRKVIDSTSKLLDMLEVFD